MDDNTQYNNVMWRNCLYGPRLNNPQVANMHIRSGWFHAFADNLDPANLATALDYWMSRMTEARGWAIRQHPFDGTASNPRQNRAAP